MSKKIIYFISIFMILGFGALNAFALPGSDYKIDRQHSSNRASSMSVNKEELRPVLTITPREIDLGSIKPGETVFGEYSLKNIAPGIMEWSTSCPDDWTDVDGKTLKGTVSGELDYLRLELTIVENTVNSSSDKTRIHNYQAIMKLEAADKELVCYKDLKAGAYRKAIKLTSAGGQRTIFVAFRINALQEIPSINLNPKRLDFGVQLPGKIISKKIELTNKGREMLKWSVATQKVKPTDPSGELQKERYISFHNNELSENGIYIIPEHLKNSMELTGQWTEKNGYPLSNDVANSIKFRFNGTGLSVFLQSHTEDGNCLIYLDENLLNLPDPLSGEWEKKELLIAEGLTDGPHVVTIVIREGSLELEGVKVFGNEIMRGPKGWITVLPNSGATTSQTNYISIKLNTAYLVPGYYGDQIVFKTNVGEEIAEIYIDIIPDMTPKIIDVYLYSKDLDYLLTADPQTESRRLIQNGYAKEGIAFRLFAPQTPGTTSFYRWYNPNIKDHFYHNDRTGGGKKLDGYVFEGSIGNIATSRMTNTRELYRWVDLSTGRHYYSTNSKVSAGIRKKYRFDGIAGYVR